jgi:hypothetical protein
MHARWAGEGRYRVESVSFAASMVSVKMKEVAHGVFGLARDSS